MRRHLRKLSKYQGGWVQIILFVVSLIISIVLAPKPGSPRAAAIEDFDVPLAEEDRPVPWLFGRKRITGANVVWYGDLDVQKIKKSSTFGGSQTVGFKYFLGLHMGFTIGPIDRFLKIEAGDKTAWTGNVTSNSSVDIFQPDLFGGDKREGGLVGTVDFMFGADVQVANPYLSAKIPGPMPAFRGTACAVFRGLNSVTSLATIKYGGKGKGGYVGTTPYVKPWAVTAERILAGWQGGTAWYPEKAAIGSNGDMNPAHIVYQCLTDSENGQGRATALIDDANFRQFADDCHAEGCGLSMLWNRSTTIDAFVQLVMDHCAGILTFDVMSGKYRVRLIRGDYDPNTLQTFNPSNARTLKNFQRRSWGETVNELTISHTDATTGKATAIVVQDLGNIRSQQARIPDKIDRTGISDTELIRVVAGRELASRSTPLARGDLEVNRAANPYGPGDVIKVEWPAHKLPSTVFRIIEMRKGNLERRTIILTLVEDIYALAGIEYTEVQPDAGDPVVPPQPADTPDNGGTIISAGETVPPVTGNLDGDRYLVGSPATGAWAGHEGQIAEWDDDNEEWIFSNVPPGALIYDEETGGHVVVDDYGEPTSAPWTPAIPPLDEVEDTEPDLATLELVVWDTADEAYKKITADRVGGEGDGGSAGLGSIVYQDGTVPAGNTVANTTLESTLSSQWLLTPVHLVLGTVIRFRAQGVYSTHSAAPTLKFRFKLNTTTILETPAFTTGTSLTNLGWSIDGNFIITTAGAAGEIEAQGLGVFALTDATGQMVFLPNTAKVSVNLSAGLTFLATAQWGSANAANTLTMRQLIINEEFVINDAPAPTWTPADTTTQLWLDAADATTITIGTGVAQWNDKSGNARHVVQATSAKQPTHGVATLDSKPVVNFDGSNDTLVGTAALAGLLQNVAAATIYIVRSHDTSGSGFPVMLGVAGNVVSGSNARAAFYLSPTEAGHERQWGQRLDADTGQSQLTGAQPGAGMWGIAALAYEYSVAQISCFKNGTQTLAPTAFQTAGNTSNTAPAAITIGSWPDETLTMDGSIAEVVITHTVDATERQKIEGYLAWKWGLESLLPGGHPYKTAPP